MAMYRDSVLGLCLDLKGPDGNIFFVMAEAQRLAAQLDQSEDWQQAVNAMRLMGANYMSHLFLFREFFPIVTLVGFDEVAKLHGVVDEILEED